MDPNEREALLGLIRQYHGNLTQMANALVSCDRQKLTRRLEQLGISRHAAEERKRSMVKGPRNGVTEHPEKERQAVLTAIIRHKGYRTAAEKQFKISARSMARWMARLGIDREAVNQEKRRRGLLSA